MSGDDPEVKEEFIRIAEDLAHDGKDSGDGKTAKFVQNSTSHFNAPFQCAWVE